jgi:hypothetical protein
VWKGCGKPVDKLFKSGWGEAVPDRLAVGLMYGYYANIV